MTFESYANRLTKHLKQAAERNTVGDIQLGTIDLTPRTQGLAFLAGKTHPQANGGSKNASGHLAEHVQALKDDQNPYLGEDGNWYWMDEQGTPNEQSYVTREHAIIALADYTVARLRTPVAALAEEGSEISKSIGGINEDSGISGDYAGEISL